MVWLNYRDFLISKASEWISKGDHENDPFNRFFSYFLAYNALYNLYAKMKDPYVDLSIGDKSRASKIKELIINPNQLVHSVDEDIKSFITLLKYFRKEKWTKKSSEYINDSLERSYNNRNYTLVLRDILRMLYKLRCNLFHGEKNINAQNQRELMDVSNKILKTILNNILNRLRGNARGQEKI